MTIRKKLLSTLALAVLSVGILAVPALAQDTPPPPAAHGGHGGPEGGPNGGPRHEKMFNADTDGDGQLSKAEFMAIHEKRFAEMDADKDGKISKDEMKSHRDALKAKFQEKRKEWEGKQKPGDISPPAQ